MSNIYHPQSNDQTKILNRYLEDYLYCLAANHSKLWFRYLLMVEWHYNTAYHSTIDMTLYEVVYGRAPLSLLDYIT